MAAIVEAHEQYKKWIIILKIVLKIIPTYKYYFIKSKSLILAL